MGVVRVIVIVLRALFLPRAAIVAENLARRQQLAVLRRSVRRPRLRRRGRIFWVWLSRLWLGWRSCLMIVKPDTVIAAQARPGADGSGTHPGLPVHGASPCTLRRLLSLERRLAAQAGIRAAPARLLVGH